MIPEKRFLNQIQQVLARLMQPLWLLDTEGTVLLPEENRSKIKLPEFMYIAVCCARSLPVPSWKHWRMSIRLR